MPRLPVRSTRTSRSTRSGSGSGRPHFKAPGNAPRRDPRPDVFPAVPPAASGKHHTIQRPYALRGKEPKEIQGPAGLVQQYALRSFQAHENLVDARRASNRYRTATRRALEEQEKLEAARQNLSRIEASGSRRGLKGARAKVQKHWERNRHWEGKRKLEIRDWRGYVKENRIQHGRALEIQRKARAKGIELPKLDI